MSFLLLAGAPPLMAVGPGESLPAAKAAGSARLTVFGFQVYDAKLWVTSGFRQRDFAIHPFALELNYLRNFSAADIAKRSLQEMRRAGNIDPAQAQHWQAALQAVLPDVKPGDRLTGINRPGRGAAFLLNGKPAGEIKDPAFAALFFGIWLGEHTSEPQLRQTLLAGTPP